MKEEKNRKKGGKRELKKKDAKKKGNNREKNKLSYNHCMEEITNKNNHCRLYQCSKVQI
jgi:hypothetical protein